MKLLLKLVILAVIAFVLYHFYGPQIDDFFARAKITLGHVMNGQHAKHPAGPHSEQEPKYYPIEKRTD
jgi:hypothetical protein